MSMPTFPQNDPPLTREGSLNEIISSIAAEELSLSHLLNVEGEKLQYVLGTMAMPEGTTIELQAYSTTPSIPGAGGLPALDSVQLASGASGASMLVVRLGD